MQDGKIVIGGKYVFPKVYDREGTPGGIGDEMVSIEGKLDKANI